MTRRECAFLLIGLGGGLLLSVAATVATVGWMMHHMFIMGVRWGPGAVLLLTPFLLILGGFVLLVTKKGRLRPNPDTGAGGLP